MVLAIPVEGDESIGLPAAGLAQAVWLPRVEGQRGDESNQRSGGDLLPNRRPGTRGRCEPWTEIPGFRRGEATGAGVGRAQARRVAGRPRLARQLCISIGGCGFLASPPDRVELSGLVAVILCPLRDPERIPCRARRPGPSHRRRPISVAIASTAQDARLRALKIQIETTTTAPCPVAAADAGAFGLAELLYARVLPEACQVPLRRVRMDS